MTHEGVLIPRKRLEEVYALKVLRLSPRELSEIPYPVRDFLITESIRQDKAQAEAAGKK